MDVGREADRAREASLLLAELDRERKDTILSAVAKSLEAEGDRILEANRSDLERAERESLAKPLLKRLKFDRSKLEQSIRGIESVARLEDPVGRVLSARELDEGLTLYQRSCPIGVVGMIFESRPDALVQIASLALKSGNGLLLKGGSEARESNRLLSEVILKSSVDAGAPEGWLVLLESREEVGEMLRLSEKLDLIIPRGSNEFVSYIMEQSAVPVLGHADGICHAYVHASAELEKAVPVVVDAKTEYVAVCNAIETLLVDREIAEEALPRLAEALRQRGVRLLGCPESRRLVPTMEEATEEEWSTEYLDYELSVKLVGGPEEAISHINRYGSGHTDTILAEDESVARRFLRAVDSASVMWNCSTRFADGYRYGLGAEVGISTNKIHARGPVGLEGLVIYKWELLGTGQVVADYAGEEGRRFTHRDLPIRE
ncbi:MAG: glutamate-5-semialdehyde dehydrogenase [Alkalispirochaetaceae bacterium]